MCFESFSFLILQLREMEMSFISPAECMQDSSPDDFRLYPTVSVQTSKYLASEADFLHQGQVSVCHYTKQF